MVTFIHTSDWQLGITRYFLNEGAQERYDHARFSRIRDIGRIARERDCAFVVVCGDVFESNQVGRKTVALALEALREVPVPVYLLPGNHDPLNDASVYDNPAFADHKPAHVVVLRDSNPVAVAPGVELLGAPWPAKRLAANPLHTLLEGLPPDAPTLRVCLGHGEIDSLAGFSKSPSTLSAATLRRALEERRAHFIALGDKHSLTRVDPEGRVWYSGTPEVTDFREPSPGFVNVVRLDHEAARVESVRVGQWTFVEMERDDVDGAGAVDGLLADVDAVPDKEHCVLRLRVGGVLDLAEVDRLAGGLDRLGEVFASLEVRRDGLHSRVGEADWASAGFGGFAAEAASILEKRIAAGGDDATRARDALLLLMRLSRGEESADNS